MDRGREQVGEETEGKVITLGWQVVLLPVLTLGVVVAGFLAGRAMAGRGRAAPPADGAGLAVSASPAPAQPGGVLIPPAQDSRPANPFPENRVIEIPQAGHPLLNQPAPDFTMTLLATDQEVSLSDYRGQTVMINFWATWCPPCRLEMPWIQNVYEANKDNGFVVLAVDAGERVPPSLMMQTVQRFVDSYGLTFPVLIGDNTYQVQREWSVLGLPATYFVDSAGKVVATHQGMFPNQLTLERQVSRFLP